MKPKQTIDPNIAGMEFKRLLADDDRANVSLKNIRFAKSARKTQLKAALNGSCGKRLAKVPRSTATTAVRIGRRNSPDTHDASASTSCTVAPTARARMRTTVRKVSK